MLTAEQRYRQAIRKARILSARELRLMMEGKREDSGTPTMDLERKFLIAEIERAYQLGLQHANRN